MYRSFSLPVGVQPCAAACCPPLSMGLCHNRCTSSNPAVAGCMPSHTGTQHNLHAWHSHTCTGQMASCPASHGMLCA